MGKSFLFFVLLLGSTTLAITDEQQKFLDEVNGVRERYADEYNVPNMHKLVWSDDLQEILKTLAFNESWPYARVIWRYTELDSYDGVTQMIDDDMTFFRGFDKEAVLTYNTVHRLELINPFQTVIACGVIPNGDGTKLICLVGPEGKGKSWDADNKPSEPAGSGCPHRYHNENGLCVPDDPSEISLFGFQDDFLTEVNELRREYAKLYNVPNMHQLVWNEELVKIIDPINWKGEWPFSRRMWRFCVFASYQKQIDLIKKELDVLIGKSAEERKSELAGMNTSNMGKLEVLNPRQSEIGCVRKWTDSNTISITCLVGTRGLAELWDFDAKSTEEPGSTCPENYKNDDGLCIPVDPIPVSIYGNPHDFVKELNDVRRKYAKEYKIPNMHQLVWSEDLVKISESLGWVGSWPAARITWRFSKVWSYRNIIENIEESMKSFLKQTEDEKTAWIASHNPYNADVLELLNPLQTVIGCAEKTETVIFLSCFIGSEGSLTLFDTSNKLSAVPGSKCSDHYKNEDGLCVPMNAADVFYLGFREDFLSEVNELRRSVAKQYHITNMHELVWNDELVKIIEPVDWNTEWPFSRRVWRFCALVSYEKQDVIIRKELEDFIRKSSEEKMEALTYMNTWNMGKLEVLNPRQSEIGCVRKWTDSNTISVVCLVGTRGRAELWDFDAKSTEEPGSACPENYKNDDGLCIPVDPTPVSIYGNPQDFLKVLNDVRRKYAKEYNIPNMHQLVWSEDLVKIIEPLDYKASWPSARKTWRYSTVWSYQNIIERIDDIAEQFSRKNETEKTAWIASSNNFHGDLLELLSPLQTVVGCAGKTDAVTIPVCLIGSEGSLTLFDFTKKSSAAPGSTCSNHYKNEDGLCVPVNAAEVSYFGFREDFLSGVNELRRSIAKQYHIPNMHELKWHEDFVDTAQSDSWPSDHPSWRYTKIKSYRDLKTIEDEVKAFLGKTEDEKKSFIADNEDLDGLELMNPEQTLIGCGKKKGEDNALTCLIGTQGKWPEVTFDANSEVAPGSKCLKDYENTDGLCTFFLPTPPPPKKVIPQGGATKRTERVTQRIPEAAAQQSDEKDEPDTATIGFPYLMITFSIILFLY
ncbi:unnamed protein product [Caenorhabditis brenneri]